MGIKEPILKVSKKPTIIVKNNTKINVFFSLFEKELKILINNFISLIFKNLDISFLIIVFLKS